MKNIKHATGSGGVLNVEHTSYRKVRIIRVTKSSTTSWGGHVERMGEKREICTELQWGNLKETNHLKDLGGDGKITLRCIIKKLHGSVD